MADSNEYTADDIQITPIDESVFESVDMSRPTFTKHLQEVAIIARDFARTLVTTLLPDDINFIVHYGCSYDGNPLVEDEQTFPEDYDGEPVTTTSPEQVTTMLWRNGFVPGWINVTVSHEDGERTYIKLQCCGRFSAKPSIMYHIGEGRPPFHVLGPPIPPNYDHEQRAKFDLYWREDA